jgi:PPOX class probable F420-dependent enzyme
MTRRLEVQNRFYDRIRSRASRRAADAATPWNFDGLRGHKYALVVTFKRDGSGVPTPIWFGLDGIGRLYFRTGADVAKVRRIRANPRVLVAPCTVRGKPVGPSVEGTVRVVPAGESDQAEAAIRSNYGLGRQLYESVGDAVGSADAAYIEVAPAAEQAPAGGRETA